MNELTKAIKVIKKYRAIEKELEKTFGKLNDNHNYGMLSNFETDYMALLKVAFKDEHDWISYFIYDCDMGENPLEITFKDGKKIKLKTVKQLYWLLTHEV